MKETGLMALPVLAKAWMIWFCITQIIQKPDWWPEKDKITQMHLNQVCFHLKVKKISVFIT